jgi:hypothetical protein
MEGLETSSSWVCQALVDVCRVGVEGVERHGAQEGGAEDEEDEFLNSPERRHTAGLGEVLRGKIPGNPG